ncbi:hypothetical protein JNUCC0626_48145 [Lentzea sp. JNUCC 0626]|uniref:hypothetical protein n=1 Tax=Lentzea sp. JNUCC 0626 TaxID=3367513 RepID=UPI0037484FA2
MRSRKAVRGLVMAAGLLATMAIGSPSASASYMHNIIIDGESLPYGTHSVSLWWPEDRQPSACVDNLSGRKDRNTGILIPSDVRFTFVADTSTGCFGGKRIKCLCGVTLRDSDPEGYLVRFSPPR